MTASLAARLARVAWFAIVLAVVVTFAAEFRPWIAVPLAHADAIAGPDSPAPYRFVGLLGPAAALVAALCWVALGVLIYRRRADDRLGFLVSLVFVLFGIANTGALSMADPSDPWSVPARVFHALSNTLLVTAAYLIPNGRFVPAWTRWLSFAFATWMAIGIVLPTVDPITARGPWELLFLLFLVSTLGSLGYRYARDATPIERLQLKWVLFGGVATFVAYTATSLLQFFWHPLGDQGLGAFLLNGTLEATFQLATLGFALTYAFSMLRYRLYDVELVINRAIVYGLTTTAVAGSFFVAIVVLQPLLRPFTGGNELAVAASTIASIALAQPARARIQATIDRAFYRARYDAGRTVDAFTERLRDEVDLDAVRADLLDAVDRTMQPASASLWLRERSA